MTDNNVGSGAIECVLQRLLGCSYASMEIKLKSHFITESRIKALSLFERDIFTVGIS